MDINARVPQDYRVTLSVSVDDRTILLVGVLVLGLVLYAKVRK